MFQLTAILPKHIFIFLSHVDPPSHALGFPIPSGGYSPLTDHNIPEEARGPAFARWVSSYYKHGDLGSRDFSQLNQREGDTSKKPTTDTIPLEELLTIADFAPAAKCEAFIVDSHQFLSAFMNQTTKALFDPQIRDNWGEHSVWFVYCEASFWHAVYAPWNVEKEDKNSEINFKSIPGANHFVRCFLVSLCVQITLKPYFIIVNVGRTGAVRVSYEGLLISLKRLSSFCAELLNFLKVVNFDVNLNGTFHSQLYSHWVEMKERAVGAGVGGNQSCV